ncbi:MAG TPA: hypothetical protein PK657_14010 [Legionella sp.]|nr:hypothetical protein [Legionella sp.]
MFQFIVTTCFLCLSFFSQGVLASGIANDDALMSRCVILYDKLQRIESNQHKAICSVKMSSAANKVESARVRILYKKYRDARYSLSLAIEEMNFAQGASCTLISEIKQAKHEAISIKEALD